MLDLAAGGGRHARLFRGRGHPVTAVDRDASGLADLRDDPGVEIVEHDLEDGSPFPFKGREFAGVVVTTSRLARPSDSSATRRTSPRSTSWATCRLTVEGSAWTSSASAP